MKQNIYARQHNCSARVLLQISLRSFQDEDQSSWTRKFLAQEGYFVESLKLFFLRYVKVVKRAIDGEQYARNRVGRSIFLRSLRPNVIILLLFNVFPFSRSFVLSR